ncbi:hypothetical protein JJC03_09175 [Flavobacterium oreochromis]|uniref:hypothetical protein n=1 Tax=Flavobacterium oreochromis TaxID=2906078 RepID=UPI001CE605E2|nr:hypothetical protein [Flavobacterium oreochromis]QYS85410.1 hypothetical protein JJC03_09175 [Flavobacterium oreochromis]
MSTYKGITFAKNYNKSFAEFKKEFSNTHVFLEVTSAELEEELNKAYKIATNHGDTSGTIGKSKKADISADDQ